MLDEPTVGVDPALRAQFWSHFRALAATGVTILVASHVMDEADRCDELVFIRSGKVLIRGSSAEVRAQAGTTDLETARLVMLRGADLADATVRFDLLVLTGIAAMFVVLAGATIKREVA